MDITVPTTAVVTVLMTLHVTNRLGTVTGDVNQDILIVAATKVNLKIHLHILSPINLISV